ncbi:MFS transporter [Sporothrix schenckii 1099-18]|uniref:MFS transporter n=1 Tax=Sporothrix schenckii 1099-18 TaxID=1397361 RepID=A0A0F2MGD7_SPOSC|nr:MFS transporter [Sporothrix schenckii 1099-18]KJR88124.1 MFS transporter [Sporothrix schenckii 1099-18]
MADAENPEKPQLAHVVSDMHSDTSKASKVAVAHEHIEGNALLVGRDGKIRRLPIPSTNPNDPLNFKTWEKAAVIVCCCWFSLLSLALAGGLGPILGIFFQLYMPQGYDANHITFLLTIPNLCIGLGNYLILPVSLAFGRRPVFLFSSVVLLAATIGSAAQNNYKAHLATRTIQGLATGASESLLPLMLTEVTYLHQRGRVFGLYWMVQSIFSAALNIASSYIGANLGWRWYYWIFAILVGVGIVLTFFCGFETRFSRPATSIDGVVVITDEFGVTHVLPDSQADVHLAEMEMQQDGAAQDTEHPTTRRSYWQKIKPWSTPHPRPFRMIVLSWLRMAQCMTSPAILFVVLSASITLGCVVDMSLTYDAVLQAKGWAAQDVGLVNVGSIVGALLGAAYATLAGDRLVLWLAKRNAGVHKPEHRLLVLVPPALLGMAMLLLYGFTAASASASSWGIVVAYTLYSVAWVTVLIVTTTFAAEAAPKHPGPALVMVVGTKNIISFGWTYGLTPLMDRGGYAYAYGVLAGVFGACFLLGIPVYVLNPRWRRYAAHMDERRGVVSTD